MLTGGQQDTANAVAAQPWNYRLEAEVLPDQKSAVVAKLQKTGRIVAMAGDGVNDAPALRRRRSRHRHGHRHGRCDGKRRDHAAEGDLGGIVRARRLSQATWRNIRQNLFFAFIYNAGRHRSPRGFSIPAFLIAAIADHRSGCDGAVFVSVVGNALRCD